MKSAIILLLSTLTVLTLTACEKDKPEATASSPSTNPLAHQVEALEKAKNLEGDMQKAVDDKLKAIDEQ